MRYDRLKHGVITAGVMLLAGMAVSAQQTPPAKKTPAASTKHIMAAADEVKWGPGPAALPPGVEVAVLEGNPEQKGLFTIRAKMPDGYAVAPHSHPTDERLTIISGTLMAGLGTTVDESAMHALETGAYAKMPARTNHYVRARGETVIQISAMGPFEVKYVNPRDDPRKKTVAAR